MATIYPASDAMMATIPAGVAPGGQFQLQTPAGAVLMVTCPPDAMPGQQIQVMVGVPVGGGEPAAMAEFERLLMATSQITIRHKGGSQKPAVATLTLDFDGTRNALSLVVNIDPESKTKKAGPWEYLRNMEPYLAFRTELTLNDGRSVVALSHPGVTGRNYGSQKIEVQAMDRDGPVSISAEPIITSIGCRRCAIHSPLRPRRALCTRRARTRLSATGTRGRRPPPSMGRPPPGTCSCCPSPL